MIKVVLWDVDGTLLNFKEAEKNAIRACFKAFSLGECTDAMLAEYSAINDRYWKMLERREKTKPQILIERFEEFFGKHSIDTAVAPEFNTMYQTQLGETAVFYPHAWETVCALQGNVLQCVVTNGTKVAQDGKLRKSGLDTKMDDIFISEVMDCEKPSAVFFEKVFEAIGPYEKDEILIVGDSLTGDMQGGINAGIKTCWFNPEGKENTMPWTPDHEIRDLAEVLTILDM